MTTPLVMLGLLAGPVLLALLLRTAGRTSDVRTAGILGLVLVLLFTASGHFIATAAMAEMLPPFVPARLALVYLTGVLEIALAIGQPTAIGAIAAPASVGLVPRTPCA